MFLVIEQAMAVSQHHDAVSGTAKQAVTYDYEERLSDGQRQGMLLVNKAYKQLLHTFLPQQELCPLLNISRCNVTETSKEVRKFMPVYIILSYVPNISRLWFYLLAMGKPIK